MKIPQMEERIGDWNEAIEIETKGVLGHRIEIHDARML